MARMPQARWLGERSPRNVMSRYDVVCVHTIVGFAPAHAAHFSVHHDGTIDQSRDTRYRSAANLNGNHRVISIENEDHGSDFPSWSGSNVPPLTARQVEANAKILAWAHETHGIPLQLCPNSGPTSRGLAYHRQGIDGNFGPFKYGGRVSGGEQWSEHFGKVCPGDRRIDQLPAILARAKQIVNGEDDDVSKADVLAGLNEFFDQKIGVYNDKPMSRDDALALGRFAGYSQNLLKYSVLKEVAAIRANQGGDPAAVAAELAPLVIPPLVAALGDEDGASPDEVEERVESALKDFFATAVDA